MENTTRVERWLLANPTALRFAYFDNVRAATCRVTYVPLKCTMNVGIAHELICGKYPSSWISFEAVTVSFNEFAELWATYSGRKANGVFVAYPLGWKPTDLSRIADIRGRLKSDYHLYSDQSPREVLFAEHYKTVGQTYIEKWMRGQKTHNPGDEYRNRQTELYLKDVFDEEDLTVPPTAQLVSEIRYYGADAMEEKIQRLGKQTLRDWLIEKHGHKPYDPSKAQRLRLLSRGVR